METKVDNLQIEAELLGLLFIEPALIDKVRGYLQVEDFEQEKHRVIYRAILQLLQDNVEIEQSLVLQEILNTVKSHQTFQNTTAQTYLSQLIDLAGIRTNLDKYVREIAKRSQRRKIKAMLKRVNQKITDERQDPDDLIQEFQREISQSRSFEYRDFVGAEKIIERTIYEIEQKVSGKTVSGLPTDFPSFDELTLGFQNGDLIIVAARPSMGKTAFALNVATNIAKHKRVGIFSLEMSSVQLFNRILASFSFIHGNKIRHPKNLTPNETRKMYVATREIKKLNLWVDDSPGLKLADLVWKARRLAKVAQIDLLVIDYLQLISITNRLSENRQMEVSLISSTLKKLARELDIPIVALSQLSRRVEQRESKIPMMSDLRESGAIEQDADLIVFLYREAYYKRDKNLNSEIDQTEIIVAKHRNGATGNLMLSFNPSYSLFTDKKD